MSLHVFADLEQRSDDWYEARCGIVTASVVKALVTTRTPGAMDYECPACQAPPEHPCRSKVKRGGQLGVPIKTTHPERVAASVDADEPPRIVANDGSETRGLAALLAAERVTGYVDPTFVNADMWRGIESEEPAREKYAEHYGLQVTTCGFMVRDDWGYRIGYSPDGLVGDNGLIEIKAPRQKGHLVTVIDGEVPPEHMAQIQTGLLVSGREWCDFISFHGGMHMWRKRVTPDPEWRAAIVAAVEVFEKTVDQMVDDYRAAVEGLPMTERLDLDMEVTAS